MHYLWERFVLVVVSMQEWVRSLQEENITKTDETNRSTNKKFKILINILYLIYFNYWLLWKIKNITIINSLSRQINNWKSYAS
jgi:hypothetical protein